MKISSREISKFLKCFSRLGIFHVNWIICLEYFFRNCLKKHWFIFNSTHAPWNLQFLQILIFWKPLLMLKSIFKAIEFWHTTEFTIFQKHCSWLLLEVYFWYWKLRSYWIRVVFIKIFYFFIKLFYLYLMHFQSSNN